MPVVIALIFGAALLAAVALFQLIWALLLLIPLYAYFAIACFLLVRSRQRRAKAAAVISRDAERERVFNEQEFKAWKAAAEDARGAKRDRDHRQSDEK